MVSKRKGITRKKIPGHSSGTIAPHLEGSSRSKNSSAGQPVLDQAAPVVEASNKSARCSDQVAEEEAEATKKFPGFNHSHMTFPI